MSNASQVVEMVKSIDGGTGYFVDETVGQPGSAAQKVAENMTILVKGAGYAVTEKAYQPGMTPGANQPLTDPDKIFSKAMRATNALKKAVKAGQSDHDAVYKSFSPDFTSRFGAFLASNPQNAMWNAWTEQIQQQLGAALGKNITLTSPNATGLVPYNLVAPSRLIYPVN